MDGADAKAAATRTTSSSGSDSGTARGAAASGDTAAGAGDAAGSVAREHAASSKSADDDASNTGTAATPPLVGRDSDAGQSSATGASKAEDVPPGTCCGCIPRRWIWPAAPARGSLRGASLYKPARETAVPTGSAASPPPSAQSPGRAARAGTPPRRRRMYAFATFANLRQRPGAPRESMNSEPNTGDTSEQSELDAGFTEDEDNASATDRESGRWDPVSSPQQPPQTQQQQQQPVLSDPASRQRDARAQPSRRRSRGVPWHLHHQAPPPEVSRVRGSFVGPYDCRVLIGKGTFGKVFLARAPPQLSTAAGGAAAAAGARAGSAAAEGGEIVAVKVLPKAKLATRRKMRLLADEKAVMADCGGHPFVLGLRHAFQTADHLCLVSEFCPGGELFFHLERATRFSERVVRFYTTEIVSALAHLHRHRVAYRDLKSENLLLDARGHIRVADFGLAAPNVEEWRGARSICGTPAYIAPEMIVKGGGRKSSDGYGFSVDWWSLGALLYDMLVGQSPFFNDDMEVMCSNILHRELTFPASVRLSRAAQELVAALLCRQPTERLGSSTQGGLASVQAHAFFAGVRWEELEAGAATPAPVQLAKPTGSQRVDTSNFDTEFTRLSVEDNLRPKRAGGRGKRDRSTAKAEQAHEADMAEFLASWNYVSPLLGAGAGAATGGSGATAASAGIPAVDVAIV